MNVHYSNGGPVFKLTFEWWTKIVLYSNGCLNIGPSDNDQGIIDHSNTGRVRKLDPQIEISMIPTLKQRQKKIRSLHKK